MKTKASLRRSPNESVEQLAAIVAAVSDAVITVDPNHRIVLFNPAAEQLFRCPSADALGRTLDRFIPAPSIGKEQVVTALRADGEQFPVEARIAQITLGGLELHTFVLRDPTERKRSEAERDELLRRERDARERAEAASLLAERVQAIVDAALGTHSVDELLIELLTRVRAVLEADTAVILLREDDDTLHVRAALGLEEDVQRAVRVPIGQGFAGRIAAAQRPRVLEEVDYEQLVSQYFREKGIQSLAGVPLEREGRVIGVLHAGSTKPRRFHDDEVRVLQLAGERIAVAIERAKAQEADRDARAAAEAANRAKDEFLSTVSHELRTPLSAMLGWIRALLAGKVSGERAQRALETIERSGRTQAKLIEDLLDVSRIVSGRMRLDMRPVNLSAIIEDAVETLRPMAEQKGIAIEVKLDAASSRVSGDTDRLRQVVWNLLNNAIKFTPGKGRVAIELVAADGEARTVVRDTGKGIARDFMPYLFVPFRQAASVKSREQAGLGLGLSIVRHIVELHGGSVTAESPGEGAGSTFTVHLPLASAGGES